MVGMDPMGWIASLASPLLRAGNKRGTQKFGFKELDKSQVFTAKR